MKHWKRTLDIDYEIRVLTISKLNPKEIALLLDKPLRSVYNSLERIKKLAIKRLEKHR